MEHGTTPALVFCAFLTFAILFNIFRARGGKTLFIRRIPGIAALDDALGRATEMGRPVLFSSGLGGLDIVTLQALSVLSHITRRAAKFRNRVIVPVYGGDATLFPVVEQVVEEAYRSEGAPDAFDRDDVRYIPGDQMAYASNVVGMMHRERTAGNFYFGYFFAESLLLAEAGQQIGAIQVAGTPTTTQVPFFIVATDYTIIGEEYFATSAYITREPVLLGSTVGQDWGKILIAALVIIGVVSNTAFLALHTGWDWEKGWISQLFTAAGRFLHVKH